jgi:hypothetical protein
MCSRMPVSPRPEPVSDSVPVSRASPVTNLDLDDHVVGGQTHVDLGSGCVFHCVGQALLDDAVGIFVYWGWEQQVGGKRGDMQS